MPSWRAESLLQTESLAELARDEVRGSARVEEDVGDLVMLALGADYDSAVEGGILEDWRVAVAEHVHRGG